MERYELSDGKSNKFWEIEVEGDGFTVRYGRIGTNGQTKSKSFDSADKARLEADKLIASKTKKGYSKVSGGDAAPAKATAPAIDSKSNPELEKAINDNPDDVGAWQVYADWLQEQGDPRGEVIALDLAGKADEAAAKIQANIASFLGALAEHQKTYDGEGTDVFGWKRGFIHSVRLSHDSYGDDSFEGSLVDILGQIIDHPSARFVREMTFVFNNDPNEDNLQDLIDLLAERAPKTLRKLHFGDFNYAGPSDETATGETEISWYAIGDLSKLWPAVSGLETLITQCGSDDSAISGDALTLGELNLPNLKHAEFRTGGLQQKNVKSIVEGNFPNIERLDIWFGVDEYGGDATTDDIGPLLGRTDLPKLKHLGLRNAVFTDALPALLVESPLLKQLEVLDLSLGCMTAPGAEALVASAEAFAHLKRIDVDENMLPEASLEALKGALPQVESSEQRDDEDDDPDYRFTSVAE